MKKNQHMNIQNFMWKKKHTTEPRIKNKRSITPTKKIENFITITIIIQMHVSKESIVHKPPFLQNIKKFYSLSLVVNWKYTAQGFTGTIFKLFILFCIS